MARRSPGPATCRTWCQSPWGTSSAAPCWWAGSTGSPRPSRPRRRPWSRRLHPSPGAQRWSRNPSPSRPEAVYTRRLVVNKFEDVKAAKDGLDVWPDIERYAREGCEAIPDDDKVRMKWYGVFFRRHIPGFFMLRIRIPNGIATTAQVRTLAQITQTLGAGFADL